MNVKVVKLSDEVITFSDDKMLSSYHDKDCCEHHYLDFEHLELSDLSLVLEDPKSTIRTYDITECQDY